MPPELAVGEPTGSCQVRESDGVDRDSGTHQQPPATPLDPLAVSQVGAQVLVPGFNERGLWYKAKFSDCPRRAF